MTTAERDAFDGAALKYCPTNGTERLRTELASMYGAEPDEILVFNGGAEALLALFFLVAEHIRSITVRPRDRLVSIDPRLSKGETADSSRM